jgi:hypothetical protein
MCTFEQSGLTAHAARYHAIKENMYVCTYVRERAHAHMSDTG